MPNFDGTHVCTWDPIYGSVRPGLKSHYLCTNVKVPPPPLLVALAQMAKVPEMFQKSESKGLHPWGAT